jgi:HK97 family phage portal protein
VGDSAATGDPDQVTLEGEERQWMPLPYLAPSPWAGWPADWSSPNWSMGGMTGGLGVGGMPGMSRLIDTAWAAIDLNASILASFPPYRLRNGVILSSPPYLVNPDPNIYSGGWCEFAKQVFWDYQLAGEAFVLAMSRAADSAGGYPLTFRAIPPWLMACELREGFRRYHLCGIDVTDDICHIRYASNTAWAHGYGPLEMAGGRMVTAGLLQRYANRLAETGGMPYHWLDVPGRKLNEAESNALLDQWVTSRLRHAGGPSVLSGGVELKQANSMNARDLALLELAQFTESRIAILCGVPPFLLGLPMAQGESITYSNASTLFDFHDRSSLRPKATAVMTALSGFLLPRGQSVELNREEYSRPGMLERAQANQIYMATGVLDRDEVRAMERFDGVSSSSASLTGAETVGDSMPAVAPAPAPSLASAPSQEGPEK